MPIYEYVCNSCEHHFETLVSGSHKPECPSCQGKELTKKLSVFAVSDGSSTSSGGPSACGSCGDPRGPGACRMAN
ncbi:MAG: zinc ribbon domain-containing protein [Myxococcota bacterium]